jgi:hypothetical protein
MVKVGETEKLKVEYFSKSLIIMVVVLLLIPGIFTIYSTAFPQKIRVGIVLTSDDLYDDAEIVQEGLNKFHDIFDTKILNINFNESIVRTQNGSYLTDDYFDSNFAQKIRDSDNVDIVLILTDKLINNWLGNRLARWGQADTRSGVALVTTAYKRDDAAVYERYLTYMGRHEILHLLGYGHPNDSRTCLMQYAKIETNLCREYELVLPYHAALWKIGLGEEPGRAAFLIRASLLLILFPLFIVSIIIAQFLFKKYIYKKQKIDLNSFVIGVGGMSITLLLVTAFIAPVIPQLVALFAVVILYVIVESLFFEFQYKPVNHLDEQ